VPKVEKEDFVRLSPPTWTASSWPKGSSLGRPLADHSFDKESGINENEIPILRITTSCATEFVLDTLPKSTMADQHINIANEGEGQQVNGQRAAVMGQPKHPRLVTVSQVPTPPFMKLANPGPLGLLGFAITTFILGLYECGAG
jgi:hypothetical protein